MTEYWQAIQAFSPSLRRFLLAVGMETTVAFGLLAVLQNLFLLRLGFDARFIGLLVGVGQLVWAAAALPASLLSNRLGLRNSLQLGLGLQGLGIALLLLVESRPEPQWRMWLLGSQGIMNLGVAFITVNIAPYVMAVTGEQERRHAFAALSALIPATAFLGSLLAGLLPDLLAGQLEMTLDQPEPYRLALWLGPLLIWLGMLPLIGADAAQVTGPGSYQAPAARAPLGLLLFFGTVAFLAAIGEGAVRTFFNVYLNTRLGVAPATIGLVMGVAQLLPIGVALSVPSMMARWGTGYTLVWGIAGIAVCLLLIAATVQVWVAAVAYMGAIAMFTVATASRDMFGQELVHPRWRTSSQAMAMLGLALGWSTAGVIGGALIETSGFSALYLASTLAALLAMVLLVGYLRAADNRQPVLPKEAVP
jgi:MFS family permease